MGAASQKKRPNATERLKESSMEMGRALFSYQLQSTNGQMGSPSMTRDLQFGDVGVGRIKAYGRGEGGRGLGTTNKS